MEIFKGTVHSKIKHPTLFLLYVVYYSILFWCEMPIFGDSCKGLPSLQYYGTLMVVLRISQDSQYHKHCIRSHCFLLYWTCRLSYDARLINANIYDSNNHSDHINRNLNIKHFINFNQVKFYFGVQLENLIHYPTIFSYNFIILTESRFDLVI